MAIRIYGNRAIKTLPGETTRPTSSRVREALFNIWHGRVLGARWLDLCAGSGAMGAEALCRGAAEAFGIEKSGAACRIVRENWQKVARSDQTLTVVRGDVVRQLEQLATQVRSGARPTFDCVYFDPPYAGSLYQPVLKQVGSCLSDRAEIAVEYNETLWQPHAPDSLEIVKEKRYGSTQLLFLRPVKS